tara:strand:- start:19885 stop:20067 length:183 start_codon:yes stop_codon:yes gene_type:complete
MTPSVKEGFEHDYLVLFEKLRHKSNEPLNSFIANGVINSIIGKKIRSITTTLLFSFEINQ